MGVLVASPPRLLRGTARGDEKEQLHVPSVTFRKKLGENSVEYKQDAGSTGALSLLLGSKDSISSLKPVKIVSNNGLMKAKARRMAVTFDESFDSEDRSNDLQNELTDGVVAFIE